jgi:hypothetical protein
MGLMKNPNLPIFVLILVLVSQAIPGIDLTHHLETSRVYYEMIAQGEVLTRNPYLLAGQQATFTYGIPFYAVSGLLWFLFGRFTVDILMLLISLLSFFIMRKIVKDVFYQTISLLLLWGFVIPDSYIAYCANFFLWLTAYLYIRGKGSYRIPLAVACLTHPFSVVVGLYYVYKERNNGILVGIFLCYHLVITFVFASQGNVALPNIINTFIARVAIGLFPLLLHEKIRGKIIKTASVTLAGAIIIANVVLFLLIEPMQLRGFYEGYHTLFKKFPDISGNMRVVDYDYLPSAYYFHKKGLTINTGSFFESWIPATRRKWTDREEYQQYLGEHHIDYVLTCKECGAIFPGAHPTEKAILSRNYQPVWENQYYTLYTIE